MEEGIIVTVILSIISINECLYCHTHKTNILLVNTSLITNFTAVAYIGILSNIRQSHIRMPLQL